MKILSFQTFSIYSNSGSSRILRRLYQDYEFQISSLIVESDYRNVHTGKIAEIIIPAYPQQRKWMRWYLRDFVTYLRKYTFNQQTIKRIRRAATSIPYDIIHVVNHGFFSSALCCDLLLSNKALWVSFHDHFSTNGSSYEAAMELWNRADRRLVISMEIGLEYSRLFGYKYYEIITDGVSMQEMSVPKETIKAPINIYFAGLLHYHYYPLFRSLADAMDSLSQKGLSFKLLLRGTQELNFLRDRAFVVDYLPISFNNDELKRELDNSDILYLPIYFSNPSFYLFSFSTKLIGYLGGKGAIFYHGPKESIVCSLLTKTDSAICCTTLDVGDIIISLEDLLINREKISYNAKKLAIEKFLLTDIRRRFWQANI